MIRYLGTELVHYEEWPKMGIWKVLKEGGRKRTPNWVGGMGNVAWYRFRVRGWRRMDQTRRV